MSMAIHHILYSTHMRREERGEGKSIVMGEIDLAISRVARGNDRLEESLSL